MRLIECYIDNFGTLSGYKLNFSEGLNTVVRENGYGKTTLTVFIKAMLYGLDKTAKHKLSENDRKHYKPWQGGRYGGTLTFTNGGKTYRIERSFGSKAAEDTATLYDVKTGKECYMPDIPLGEAIFEIDEDGFERTLFLSEENLAGKNDNKTVSAKISNLAGTEGDLSVMDDAIELLEKERKIYHRRGGAGLIGEVKEKISALGGEINALLREKEGSATENEEAARINKELEELYSLKKNAQEEARLENERRIKRTYERQYSEMKATLAAELEARDRLHSFFKQGVPTDEEIALYKEKAERARHLSHLAQDERASESFREVARFFDTGLDGAAYSEAEELLRKLDEKKRERLSAQLSASTEQSGENKLTEKGKGKGTLPLAIAALVIGVASLALAFLSKYLIVLGAVLLIFGGGLLIPVFTKGKKVGDTANNATRPDILPENRIAKADAEIEKIAQSLRGFLNAFPTAQGDTLEEKVKYVLQKRAIYEALYKDESEAIQKRLAAQTDADALKRECATFISRFEVLSDRPFDEISRNTFEFRTICRTVEKMNESIRTYAAEHGIVEGADATQRSDTESTVKIDTGALEEQIRALEGRRILLDRERQKREAELLRIDDLYAERDELTDTVRAYEEKLQTITLTKDFLTEAKDNLTSRYLEKTKCAFDKYVALIGSELGEEFIMDTSFTVMKSERGEYKPTEAYSRGTRDFIALATRLALIDALYEKEVPFIILDDPFAYFDDARLEKGLKLLRTLGKERQIIYLTATKARA